MISRMEIIYPRPSVMSVVQGWAPGSSSVAPEQRVPDWDRKETHILTHARLAQEFEEFEFS